MDTSVFELLVLQTSEAVIFADCEGTIRIWNPAAEALFGFSTADAVGSSLDIMIPERLRPAHWQGFRRAIETKTTRSGDPVRTTRSLHKAGRKLYVEMSFSLVKNDAGVVLGSVAVARDGTSRFLQGKEGAATSKPPVE